MNPLYSKGGIVVLTGADDIDFRYYPVCDLGGTVEICEVKVYYVNISAIS